MSSKDLRCKPSTSLNSASAVCCSRKAVTRNAVKIGQGLYAWETRSPVWRFTRNNGITEGFHTKMELLQRQAYGFRKFQNYRLRVRVRCS